MLCREAAENSQPGLIGNGAWWKGRWCSLAREQQQTVCDCRVTLCGLTRFGLPLLSEQKCCDSHLSSFRAIQPYEVDFQAFFSTSTHRSHIFFSRSTPPCSQALCTFADSACSLVVLSGVILAFLSHQKLLDLVVQAHLVSERNFSSTAASFSSCSARSSRGGLAARNCLAVS